MIKAVLDVNILISALFWKGAPYKVVQKGLGSAFIMLVSLNILKETRNKLISKFQFPKNDTDDFLELITVNSEIIIPAIKLDVVKKDSSDDKIIECAVEGKAEYIVSGDRHLLDIKEYKGIRIMPPHEFLKLL